MIEVVVMLGGVHAFGDVYLSVVSRTTEPISLICFMHIYNCMLLWLHSQFIDSKSIYVNFSSSLCLTKASASRTTVGPLCTLYVTIIYCFSLTRRGRKILQYNWWK